MDFNLSEEQTAIQDSLKRYLAKDYSFDQRRTLTKSALGHSEQAWATYAELGLLALPFPESAGGLGGNAIDTMLIAETLGTALALEPFIPSVVIAGNLINDIGSPAQRDTLLGGITQGTLLATLAHHESGARYNVNHVATTAKKDGDGWSLTGHKAVVLAAPSANKLLVSARTSGSAFDANGISLFVVDAKAAGLTIRPYGTQDGQRAGEVILKDVKVAADALVGAVNQALPAIEHAIDRGIAALCAEAVGVMTTLNAQTLEYLKNRKQFDQPIGKFQVLQHRMADMAMAAEYGRAMALLAAVKVDEKDVAERRRNVSAAKAYIGQSARTVGQGAVQMHGGMGVTDELMAAHLFKRLTVINATLGDVDHHLGKFSDSLLAA
ncbi:MAG: acyl-CoA dehydrogenase family protein [Cytophagales bacterium]|nr:acyl-CoA dehydrogenase family protein [Rhizobacter sp.]